MVREKKVGRTRVFKVNYEDERVSLFRRLAASDF